MRRQLLAELPSMLGQHAANLQPHDRDVDERDRVFGGDAGVLGRGVHRANLEGNGHKDRSSDDR